MKQYLKSNRYIAHLYHRFRPLLNKIKKIRGVQNKVIKKSIPLRFSLQIKGNDNLVKFESGSRLENIKVFIFGNGNRITVEHNCIIKDASFWIEDNNCEIYIGRNTTIESADFGVSEDNSKVVIGEDCMLSSGIKIMSGDSHSIIDVLQNKRTNYAQDVFVGNHVWVGTEVMILKGASISDNCVIGARSIINKSFDSNKLIVGSPAKIIKENINWDRRRI